MDILHLKIFALEVETFPLVRSLLTSPQDSALIVDIGDLATTYHVIDAGTPRVSHTIEYGGHNITQAIADALHISYEEAETQKVEFGLSSQAPAPIQQAVANAVAVQTQKAKSLLDLYRQKENRLIKRSLMIGGGANLKDLAQVWGQALGHNAMVGNPWKGLSYPQGLESILGQQGPTYSVAVGLALRGLQSS
jgi:Tfp pilus assembly PilM family ATPase